MKDYLKEYADRLINNGYFVVPVNKTKGTTVQNWQNLRFESYDEIVEVLGDTRKKDHKGVGILCNRTGVIGVDIDVYSVEVVSLLKSFLRENYGDGLLYRYGNRPKVLIPFRYEGVKTTKRTSPFYNILSPDNKMSRIEIIRGGQFVAFNEYGSGKYEWEKYLPNGNISKENASLIDVPFDELPIIDEEGIDALFVYFDKVCRDFGYTNDLTSKVMSDEDDDVFANDKSKLALALPEVVNLINELADLDPSYLIDNDKWVHVGMALWHQTDGSQVGYDTWIKWSRRNGESFNQKDHDKGEHLKRWKSFDPDLGTHDVYTMASIIYEYNKLKAKHTAEVYTNLVSEVDGAKDLQSLEKIVTKISTTKLNPVMREALVAPVKRAYKRLDMEIGSIAILRKKLAYSELLKSIPDWCRNWVYVDDKETFFNTETKREMSVFSFDANFNQAANQDSDKAVKAHRVALDVVCIPKVKNLRYDPSGELFVYDNEYVYANTYRFDVIPELPEEYTDEQKWGVEVFRHHIMEHLIEDKTDAEIFMCWLASIVKNTGSLMGWACVLQGVEGDGKTTIANIMQHVLGKPNVQIIGNEVVQGKFKSWVAGHVFCVIEEIDVKGKDKFQTMNNLKQYITNPEVDLHRKGENAQTVPNFSNYLFLTNDQFALPVGENDRRYFFMSSRFQLRSKLVKFKTYNPTYYRDLIYVRNNPKLFAGAIRKFLLEYPVPHMFNATQEAPMNATKRNIIQTITGGDEYAILNEVLSKNGNLGCNKVLFNLTQFSKNYIDPERELSLRSRWKSIFASLGMHKIVGHVKKDNVVNYFYSTDPARWTSNKKPDGVIDRAKVLPYVDSFDEEVDIFNDDFSPEDL